MPVGSSVLAHHSGMAPGELLLATHGGTAGRTVLPIPCMQPSNHALAETDKI